jgi:hypothetical protein
MSGNSTVEQPGIQTSEAVMGGKPVRERPLSGRGRAIDGNDNALSQ